MRIRDAFKLAKWEMKIGKKEYILSVLVQGILLTCILFSVGLFCNIDSIVDSYLCKNNGNSYEFELRNFDESDKEWLFKKGFYDFLCSDGQIIYASTNSIEHIWTKKISALIKGKDIWNEETDKIIEIILFCKIIIGFLTGVLYILLISNMLNSIEIKMLERNRYKNIISGVGMKKEDIKDVYLIYFLCRTLIIISVSELAYWGLNTITNNYINSTMLIHSKISFLGIWNSMTALIMFAVTFLACSRRIKVKNEI